jgi:hypothetical protein
MIISIKLCEFYSILPLKKPTIGIRAFFLEGPGEVESSTKKPNTYPRVENVF